MGDGPAVDIESNAQTTRIHHHKHLPSNLGLKTSNFEKIIESQIIESQQKVSELESKLAVTELKNSELLSPTRESILSM